eukprot:16431986-Heterocapsa_arctica.AAC.1
MARATCSAATWFPLARGLASSLNLLALMAQAFALPCSSPDEDVVAAGKGPFLRICPGLPLP